ncbi:fibronectin type III domain-containing protein [Marinobacter halotolerans]|uniref:fibronectin type III domain-containing protein n=1 Tax=Marinobacter halotolerans TaxID=1569211 RepID=UPI001244C9AF|nr:fibronectin type III domain-containing protein [Marinobacter halotolerans]
MTGRPDRSSAMRFISLCALLPLLMSSGCQEVSGTSQPLTTSDRPTLRWEAPATREDGSRLYSSDIKEYRIYYRLRHHDTFKAIPLPVEKGTAFTLTRFKPGAYEFSVTAVDDQGRESRRSDGVAVDLI